jgi:tRNA G18 (ribose-2'-O)-methylase SpoU
MHNVGSVFRTCDAFAVEALYLCGYTPAPPHRDIHKTALGATETVTWKNFVGTMDAVNEVRNAGYKVFAVEQAHNSTMLDKLDWKDGKVALVFGNEVTGVSDEVLKAADGCIEIPQWGSKHSMNISVSAGVVLWEMVKRFPL